MFDSAGLIALETEEGAGDEAKGEAADAVEAVEAVDEADAVGEAEIG